MNMTIEKKRHKNNYVEDHLTPEQNFLAGLSTHIISDVQYCTSPVRNDFHHHNEYELIFVLEGTIEIEINNNRYQASDNTLILITNLENHSVHQLSTIYRRYYVTLHTIPTDAFIHNYELLNLLKNHTGDFSHCIDVTDIKNVLTELFEKLLTCNLEDKFSNELIGCYLSELLIHVIRKQSPSPIGMNTWKRRILNIQAYIDIHYREKLRIEEICRLFFISTSCLSHQFKELTGYSPKQYLTAVRMKSAAIKIHDTNLPIYDIAAECGFSDINNFVKQFKAIYGCTPGKFRK